MRQVVLFPDNKLSASICSMYNGHVAAVTQDTDTLAGGSTLAELELFRNNLQGTVFVGVNYANSGLRGVAGTGRISFGLYYETDRWVNPTTQVSEVIPDYSVKAWSAEGVAHFTTKNIGDPKGRLLPNHGQEFYTLSNGALGYNTATGQLGASQGYETYAQTTRQLDYFKNSGLTLSSGSYRNGKDDGAMLYKKHLLGMRNSDYSYTGDADVNYNGLTRKQFMSKPSSTRTWDAIQAGQFATQADALSYAASQVQRAINTNGWYNDFMHWHNVASANDYQFFGAYYAALDAAIGSADVWRAGYGEVVEYAALKDCIRRVGSFEHNGKVYLSVHLKDAYKGTLTDGLDDAIDTALLQTPLSVQVDLTGTTLAGKNIACGRAHMIRRLSDNKWIVSVKPQSFKEGYFTFEIKETAGTTHYYNAATPILSVNGTAVISNIDCKFVVWRKLAADDDRLVSVVSRTTEYAQAVSVTIESGYTYYVGAISRSNMSSLIKVN